MNATKTSSNRRGGVMSNVTKKFKGIKGVQIQARGEDGKKYQVKVPAKTLLKALGWGAAVLIGIQVAKAGVRKFKQRKLTRAGRAVSGRSATGRVRRAASRRGLSPRSTSRRRGSSSRRGSSRRASSRR